MTEQQVTNRMRRIRLGWTIDGFYGHGLPFPPEKRKLLEEWCSYGNTHFGSGTHWIEEFEA